MGVRSEAPDPVAPSQYRGRLRLERLASGRFEWRMREELAVGHVRPADLAATLDALFRGAEASDEARARAAIAAGFPRATAKLGLALALETLALTPDPQGAVGLRVAVRLTPAGLKATAPRYAAFLEKYLTPIRTRVAAAYGLGATW